jgi:hypothetical protein
MCTNKNIIIRKVESTNLLLQYSGNLTSSAFMLVMQPIRHLYVFVKYLWLCAYLQLGEKYYLMF